MKRFIFFLPALILTLASCTPSSKNNIDAARSFKGTAWTAGFSQVELVPPGMDNNIYYMAGYSIDKPITGVLDYPMARALWLDDNSGTGGIIIATVDCIGLPRVDVEKIRSMLKDFQKETGCRSINIIATHTHAGVDTLGIWGPAGMSGRSPLFMQVVYNGVVEAVTRAYESRLKGKLFYGSAVTEDIQNDSRLPHVFDSAIHCLRFEPDSGAGGIRIINYAAHPEALRSRNTLLSADFPAYMAEFIKQESSDDTIFIPGAIGGLINTKRQYDDNGEELSSVDSVILTGRKLADYVLSIKEERELTPDIAVFHKEISIPLDNNMYITMAFLGVLKAQTLPRGGRYNISMVTEAGFLVLGDLKIFLVPGELFPELAYGAAEVNARLNPPALAEIAGEEFLVFGLCNDEIGYIVTPSDFLLHEEYPYFLDGIDEFGKSRYEETNSVGPLAAERIINALRELHTEASF